MTGGSRWSIPSTRKTLIASAVLNGIFWVSRSGAPWRDLPDNRGYDADWIRALASKRGVWANIPPRCNRNEPTCFSPHLYRARNLLERFFNKIKQCRRIATRYDKLAANYLAFVQLASIGLWLRVNESTS